MTLTPGESMINIILLIGALLGLTSVCGGAYVDHALAHMLDSKTLAMIKTALHYHQLYAILISAIGLIYLQNNRFILKLAAWVFILGIVLFSFGIYIAVISHHLSLLKIVPIGGTLLMIGWTLLAVFAFTYRKTIK